MQIGILLLINLPKIPKFAKIDRIILHRDEQNVEPCAKLVVGVFKAILHVYALCRVLA